MKTIWISIKDIPATGKNITLDDQAIWLDPMKEFDMPCTVREPLSAALFLIPQEDGCLMRGRITGTVSVPCDRCAEDAVVTVDQPVDEYFTTDKELTEDSPEDEPNIRTGQNGGLEIEVARILWEEFVVALPVKPLCTEACEGLCPTCGSNLNTSPCDCEKENLDPRLAVLRNLKVDN